MKYIILFLTTWFIQFNLKAQHIHPCAKSKLKNKTNNSLARVKSSYMPPENNYDLKFYHLNINIERNSLFISGNVVSKALVTSNTLDTFAFVLHQNHSIDSVYINGVKRAFIRKDSLAKATVGIVPISQSQLFDAIVYYHGTAPSGGGAAIGNGYNVGTSGAWLNEVSWSLSESFVAYEWFPCKQDLRDKIDSSWVFATTDSANMVGSNGLLKNVVTIGNKKRYEWKSNYPIVYYLISVATAKYRPYNLYAKPTYLNGDSIFIQNFIYDNAINNPQWGNQKTTLNNIIPTMNLQCNLFGMYPFYKEKYGHCMTPFSGGMEHQTMTSLGFFDFELDAHELGHQWWGDNVTCASWKDIFINEGWASYSEYLCNQYLPTSITGMNASTKMNNVHSSVMSQPGGSSYFTNADTMDVSVIFDSRLTYDKGSAIVHSLRYEINNDSVFFPAIRAFQNTFSSSTASVIDLKNFMQNYTGHNFQQFFNQWYYGEGYPTFDVTWNQLANTCIIKSIQTQSMPSSVPLFITPLDYRISRIGKPDTIIRLFHGQTIENYTLPLTGTVTSIGVDPNNWILNKVIGPVKDQSLTYTGLTDYSLEPLVFIGPSPTSDVLNIYTNSNKKMLIELVDVTGKLIVNKDFTTHIEFDISKYANGIYTISIKNTQGDIIKTNKIIKN